MHFFCLHVREEMHTCPTRLGMNRHNTTRLLHKIREPAEIFHILALHSVGADNTKKSRHCGGQVYTGIVLGYTHTHTHTHTNLHAILLQVWGDKTVEGCQHVLKQLVTKQKSHMLTDTYVTGQKCQRDWYTTGQKSKKIVQSLGLHFTSLLPFSD